MKLTLASASDSHLPTSHTCFFALDLPQYSSEAIMREKLLFAIQFCKAIDTDVRVTDGVLGAISSEEEVMEDADEDHASSQEYQETPEWPWEQRVELHSSRHTDASAAAANVLCFPADAPKFMYLESDVQRARELLAHAASWSLAEFKPGITTTSGAPAWHSGLAQPLDQAAAVTVEGGYGPLRLLRGCMAQLYTTWQLPNAIDGCLNLHQARVTANTLEVLKGGAAAASAPNIGHDAMGRVVVEDGVGRMRVLGAWNADTGRNADTATPAPDFMNNTAPSSFLTTSGVNVVGVLPLSSGRHAFEFVAYDGVQSTEVLSCGLVSAPISPADQRAGELGPFLHAQVGDRVVRGIVSLLRARALSPALPLTR